MSRFPWLAALAALASLPHPVRAQTPPAKDSVRLEELVVTASRSRTAARVRATAADLIEPAEAARRQQSRLADLLRLLPGTGPVGTGALGGVVSPFLRGVNSSQTLLLIDGIRVNDANAVPGALLGGFELAAGDRIEVARGPQSTQFGGAAIGGVIAVGAAPIERSALRVETEAGSFATVRARAFGSARAGRVALRGGFSAVDSDNDRPDNHYDQRTEQLLVAIQAGPRVVVGGSVRGLQQSFTSPGDLRTSNSTPVGFTTFDHTLGTAFLDAGPLPGWSTRLTLGGQGYYLSGRSRFNGGPEFRSLLEVTRWVADWQHRIALGSAVSVLAGVNAEWTDAADNDGPKEERLRAAFAEVSVAPVADLVLSAGGRHDDYSTFGARTTGRVTAAWYLPGAGVKLRATAGSGFLPPSLAARYGSPFQRPNPEIRPERSRGYDAGIDRFFARGRAVASLTWFQNDLEDLIGFESAPFPELGRSVNVARARTRGVEAAVRAEVGAVDLRASYTWLDADDLSATDPAERRLIRRPRHAAGFDLGWHRGRVTVGAGAVAALDREDTDFSSFPFVRVNPGDYLDGRVYAEWRAGAGFAARARVENVFGERYEEVRGFPALGRRLTVGLTFDGGR